MSKLEQVRGSDVSSARQRRKVKHTLCAAHVRNTSAEFTHTRPHTVLHVLIKRLIYVYICICIYSIIILYCYILLVFTNFVPVSNGQKWDHMFYRKIPDCIEKETFTGSIFNENAFETILCTFLLLS